MTGFKSPLWRMLKRVMPPDVPTRFFSKPVEESHSHASDLPSSLVNPTKRVKRMALMTSSEGGGASISGDTLLTWTKPKKKFLFLISPYLRAHDNGGFNGGTVGPCGPADQARSARLVGVFSNAATVSTASTFLSPITSLIPAFC